MFQLCVTPLTYLQKPKMQTVTTNAATSVRERSDTANVSKEDPRTKRFWTDKEMPDLDGKTYIVTGSSSGMGWYTANSLAQHGAHVIMCARSLERTQAAAGMIKDQRPRGSVEAMEVDLSSFRSIVDFAKAFQEKNLPLDGLVNNAGVFLVNHDFTQEGFETSVGTSYFGHFLLTHLLLDNLKKAKGRIVSTASLFELVGDVKWNDLEHYNAKESGLREYSNAKVMIIMMVRELNKRLKGTGVEAFASHPGLVQTELNGRKLDHRKLSSNVVDITTKLIGQKADVASNCLKRPISDPNVTGYGGSYFGPPFLWLVAFNLDHGGMREPGNKWTRDEPAWAELYNRTINIVNQKLKEKQLGEIKPVVAH